MFHLLSHEFISQNLNDFLCQYSEDNTDLLFDGAFEPESFTALEKMNGVKTLFFADISFDEWIGNMLREQFICSGLNSTAIDKAVNYGTRNFKTLLAFCGENRKIYNQEVVDLLRRISVFTLTGELGENINTAREFNQFAHSIMPYVIHRIRSKNLSIQELLKISVVSGLSGLDLKGATAAASSHKNDGIPMGDLVSLIPENAAKIYLERLIAEYSDRSFPIFHADEFINSIKIKKQSHLVWMTDDIIESYFDLLVIEKLLSSYNIVITLIPKNGRFGNDASFTDICEMMYPALNEYLMNGRFRVSRNGPLMAAANLRKLSNDHASSIIKSDAVILKGCRISEMFNGGINAHTYVAYSIVRKVSEKITGYTAESKSSVFFHLKPGEYAFWGVKGCDDIFKMGHAFSTLRDHFSDLVSIDDAIKRFNSIKSLLDVYEGDVRPIYQELDFITDSIAKLTACNYDKVALRYGSLERRHYSEYEEVKWQRLVSEIKKYYGTFKKIKLLDIGVGDGKGIRYAHNIGLDVWGCDVSDEFIKMSQEQLPDEYRGRIKKCDMRSLCFGNASFHIVRHNATLVHMPMIGPGYGADKAISEANRVLVTGGLLYISLKIGNSDGVCCIDTDEGLGKRIYQLYCKSDVEKLLSKNGFSVIDVDSLVEQRNQTQKIEWYNIIAQKL